MKLTRNERLIIALAACTLVFILNVKYITNPFIEKVVEVKKVHQVNQDKINNLTQLEQEKEERKKREKFFRYELELITQKLPNSIVPETFVSQLRNAVMQFGVETEKITFTEPTTIKINGVSPKKNDNDIVQKANDSIYKLFKNNDLEDTKANDKILQFTNINENDVIKVDVEFGFSGSYENVKNLISYIESENREDAEYAKNMVIIDKIDITSGKGEFESAKTNGNISGTMTLSFYGIKDSSIPVYNLWNKEIERGKLNFFSLEGSQRFDIESASSSDFDIQLHRVTSDYPSVILSKHGEYNSKIYGDNFKNELVYIELRGQNGQYQYRYKTQSVSYPSNYSWASFTPRTPKDLIIKVYSTPRINAKDTCGIDLKIINNTDRKVEVLKYHDDETSPRLKYSIQK